MKLTEALIVILAVIFILVVAIWPADAEAERNIWYMTYTVQPGETLWQIANDHYPDQVTGEMVFQIRSINARDGQVLLDPLIRPGQELQLPVY